MLKTETDTRAMERLVLRAAGKLLFRRGRARYVADFEHGQWWVTELGTGAQWSVHDAEGEGSALGFCFEQVSGAQEW